MTARGRTAGLGRGLVVGLGLAATLAACSSGGPTLFQRIGTLAEATLAGPEAAAPGPALTRAGLERIASATIAVSKDGGPRAILVPVADNDGYLNYRDPAGDAIVMLGGSVSGTQSLGDDLRAVRHGPQDPIAHPRPLADWPERVQREYQYGLRDLGRYGIALDCVFTQVARETIEIIERRYDVVRVNETCTNARRQVTNTYWVAADSGFIWKSEQWLGPRLGHVTVEIIRPPAG